MSEQKTTRKKIDYFFTPPGKSVYPKLITPDTKFKAEGEFSTKLEYSLTDESVAKGVRDMIERIDRELDRSLKIMEKDLQENPRKDKKTGKAIVAKLCEDLPYFVNDEVGTATFSYKMKAEYKDKDGNIIKREPVLVDANGEKILNRTKLNIGGGSILIVNYYIMPWFTDKLGAGVKLALCGVQICKLVKYERDLGFSKQEGGYVQEKSAAAAATGNADHEGDTDFENEGHTTEGPEAEGDKAPEDF